MALAATVTAGAVRAYAIDPVRASWSGKAHPTLGVSEIVTCNWDELDSTCYVPVFADCACALGESA